MRQLHLTSFLLGLLGVVSARTLTGFLKGLSHRILHTLAKETLVKIALTMLSVLQSEASKKTFERELIILNMSKIQNHRLRIDLNVEC